MSRYKVPSWMKSGAEAFVVQTDGHLRRGMIVYIDETPDGSTKLVTVTLTPGGGELHYAHLDSLQPYKDK